VSYWCAITFSPWPEDIEHARSYGDVEPDQEVTMEAMAMTGAATRPGLRMLTSAGGLVLLAQGVAAATSEQHDRYAGSTGDLLSDGLLGAGLLLTLAGLERLRRRLSPRMAGLAIAGQVALVVSTLATVAAGHEVLDAVFIGGTLAWIAGLAGVAIAAARTRERMWRPAVALPLVGLVALAFADAGGAALLGLVWLVLGTRAAQQ
jgi:hypothetical protein